MNKRFIILSSILISLFSLYGCYKANHEKNTFKIAVISPLSGPYKILGQSIANGVALAVNETNENGGINGKEIELIKEDDGGLVGEGAFFAYRLTRTQMILGVIGHLNSDISIPASEFYARAMIVEISPGSTSPYLTERKSTRGYIFRTIGRDDTQGIIAAKHVLKNNYKRIAVLYNDRAYGRELAGEFVNALESLPITNIKPQIVYYNMIEVGKEDFNSFLSQLASYKPDVIFLAGEHDDAGNLVKDFHKHELEKVQFIGGDGIDHKNFIDLAGKNAEGSLTISTPPIINKSFIDKYRKTYNEIPTGYAANSYNAANILIQAIKTVNSDDTVLIAQEVAQTKNFNGVTGKISFNKHGDLTTPGFVLSRIVNGKFVVLKE